MAVSRQRAGEHVDVLEIKEKVKCFLKSRRNSNNLVDLISALSSEDVQVVLAAQMGVQKVFVHLIQQKEMFLEKSVVKDEELQEVSVEEQYICWLQERYQDCKHSLLELLAHDEANVQELALCILMKFVALEGMHPIKPVAEDQWYFPELFQEVLRCLLTSEKDMSHIITRFQEFSEYDDIKYYTLKVTLSVVKQHESKAKNEVFCENAFGILSQIKLSSAARKTDDGEPGKTLVQPVGGRNHFTLNYGNCKKIFSSVWMEFLKCKLSGKLYKKILIILHDQILPHFHKPLLLTDFLTESYNIGGAVSLLALNSLFFLIQKYNLEYPDFFKKFYALFDLSIISSKYQARFFFLSDLFLTSTHLPAYLVAAFCKRLCRLALMAPPNTILKIISFVRNLLIRHPNLRILLHKRNAPTVLKDPYLADESDPSLCKAIESSLWELKTLHSHWHPDVQTKAKFIENSLPEMESDLSGLLDLSIPDMMRKHTKKKFKEVPLSYDKPCGLFDRSEDKMGHLWTVR